MEFNPGNPIVKLCMQGMEREEKGDYEHAGKLFLQAYEEANNGFEKYLAAFFIARNQKNITDKLGWYQTTLAYALKENNDSVKGALSSLYQNIAKCYEALGDLANAAASPAPLTMAVK